MSTRSVWRKISVCMARQGHRVATSSKSLLALEGTISLCSVSPLQRRLGGIALRAHHLHYPYCQGKSQCVTSENGASGTFCIPELHMSGVVVERDPCS